MRTLGTEDVGVAVVAVGDNDGTVEVVGVNGAAGVSDDGNDGTMVDGAAVDDDDVTVVAGLVANGLFHSPVGSLYCIVWASKMSDNQQST